MSMQKHGVHGNNHCQSNINSVTSIIVLLIHLITLYREVPTFKLRFRNNVNKLGFTDMFNV